MLERRFACRTRRLSWPSLPFCWQRTGGHLEWREKMAVERLFGFTDVEWRQALRGFVFNGRWPRRLYIRKKSGQRVSQLSVFAEERQEMSGPRTNSRIAPGIENRSDPARGRRGSKEEAKVVQRRKLIAAIGQRRSGREFFSVVIRIEAKCRLLQQRPYLASVNSQQRRRSMRLVNKVFQRS
ncbi:hypothetical protein KM043_005043 [Ampulex compressa]|nr:hypothetical protein KM043_005043 [Ampulex compressa]